MPLPTIHVAAAAIIAADGRFLLASRPADKPYAGYWEFPGGKIEAGESAYQALVRELNEELGIHITLATPWITRTHDYATVRVVLNFYRVTAWIGEPQPCEGQTLRWQDARHINVAPLLAANLPVIKALSLPTVMGITLAQADPQHFLPQLDAAFTRGLQLVQIREKDMDAATLHKFAREVTQRAHAQQAYAIINADINLAHAIDADGVQLTSSQLASLSTRPDFLWVGASCHNVEELDRAEQLGCDYALLSPVLTTASHPGAATLGWDTFAQLSAQRSMAIFALGGLSLADLALAQQHGAHGIALLRGAWQ